MMGKDCERILFNLNKLIDAASVANLDVTGFNAPPIKIKAEHTHDEHGNSSQIIFEELETEVPLADTLVPISEIVEELNKDFEKLDILKDGLYTEATLFNNSIGSPWIEIKRLRDVISNISGYAGKDYVGDRSVIISLLTSMSSTIIDAKWAIIFYHDYIQRGYDNVFNDNEPSITTKKNYKNDELDVKRTMGVRNQQIENNVHIKKDNYDTF